MFTLLKVRANQKPGDYSDPGDYAQPPGTQSFEYTGPAAPAPQAPAGMAPASATSPAAGTARKPHSHAHH